jgi:hypothetical protein
LEKLDKEYYNVQYNDKLKKRQETLERKKVLQDMQESRKARQRLEEELDQVEDEEAHQWQEFKDKQDKARKEIERNWFEYILA